MADSDPLIAGHRMQHQAEGGCDQHHADGDENRRNANHVARYALRSELPHPGKHGNFRHRSGLRSPKRCDLSINVDSQELVFFWHGREPAGPADTGDGTAATIWRPIGTDGGSRTRSDARSPSSARPRTARPWPTSTSTSSGRWRHRANRRSRCSSRNSKDTRITPQSRRSRAGRRPTCRHQAIAIRAARRLGPNRYRMPSAVSRIRNSSGQRARLTMNRLGGGRPR